MSAAAKNRDGNVLAERGGGKAKRCPPGKLQAEVRPGVLWAAKPVR